MARYGTKRGPDGGVHFVGENEEDDSQDQSDLLNNPATPSPPRPPSRNISSPVVPGAFPPSLDRPLSRTSNATDASIGRAIANLTISAPIDADRLADMGHILSGGSNSDVNSMASSGRSGSGKVKGCHGYKPCHKKRNESTCWKDKYFALLCAVAFGMAIAYLVPNRPYDPYDVFKKNQAQTRRLRVPKRPLLTIAPPSSLVNTMASEMRKIPWLTLHKENEVFAKLAKQTRQSSLPSPTKEKLQVLLQKQNIHSQASLDQLSDLFNDYTTFVNGISNDLILQIDDLDKNIDNPKDLLELVEKGPWPFKTEITEPAYAENAFDLYKQYWSKVEEQRADLKLKLDLFYDQNEHTYCKTLNTTLTTFLSNVTATLEAPSSTPSSAFSILLPNTPSKRTLINQKTFANQVLTAIQKPCTRAAITMKQMRKYERDFDRVMNQCIGESEFVTRYVMPWKNYWGRNDDDKKRVYSTKVLEAIKGAAERAVGILEEVGGPGMTER